MNARPSSLASIILPFVAMAAPAQPLTPGPIPADLRDRLRLADFYQKHCAGSDIPVVGSGHVRDHALAEAGWIVRQMLAGRGDLIQAMNDQKVRVVVMAASESTTDVPEHANLRPKTYWDRRARGLGATPSNPTVSCGEENLLGFPRDPYPNENIFVHEFAHAIHGTGLNRVDKTFDARLRAAFEDAKVKKRWANTYAGTNRSEYWAEGVQCWFDDNAPPDALHNRVRTRKQLMEHDPGLAALCKEVFGEREWRYLRPGLRPASGRAHLAGFDAATLPRFRWKEYPVTDKPVVTIESALGEMTFTLDAKAAPAATRNFLKIALDGGYHSGTFDRVFTDPADAKTGWVGVTAKKKWLDEYAKDLPLEPLPQVPAKPIDGTIAMVRNGKTVGEFVIFTGTPPAGNPNVVPFGSVTKGLETIRKMRTLPAVKDVTKDPINITRVIRTE
jgi:cyclophilin family peptidyl-prolyl cis-trans isomerase